MAKKRCTITNIGDQFLIKTGNIELIYLQGSLRHAKHT